MTTDIKIREELWNLIVAGKKTTEFRKLCKGLDTGTYRFVSIERDMTMEICGYCYGCDMGWKCEHITPRDEPVKIFGTATLTPYRINPYVSSYKHIFTKKTHYTYGLSPETAKDSNKYGYCPVCDEEEHEIDKLTYDFVTENYVDKHDFVAYDITDVKDLRNE